MNYSVFPASSLGNGADMMFHASPIPMWIYDRATLRFVDVNDAAIQRYGYTREEFLALTIADIRPPEDVERLMARVSEERQGWRPGGVWRHRAKSGAILFVEITSHDCVIAGRPSVMVAGVDVSELRAANERLERSERRYRELVESLNDIVWTTDLTGTVTYLSPNAEEYGYRVNDLLGKPFRQLVHTEDVPHVLEAMSGAGSRSPVRCEYRGVDASGGVHHVRASFRTMFDDEGRPVGLSGVLMDITEQRRAEEQLRVSQRLEAVGRLAGGVAHDFNNLLVVIKGYAELGLDRLAPGDPLRGDLQEILMAGQRAASLTQQLLAFGRKQLLRPAAADLNDIVRGMTAMLQRVIGEDILFETDLAAELPSVFIDAAQLENAVLNLVVNARDAMPEGGRLQISTAIRPGHAELSEALTGRPVVVLTITDSGIGMDEATRARAFEPFFTTKPLGQGSGLGLPMVYGFVKQSGGALDLWSEPGAGCRISIALPSHAPLPGGQLPARTAPVQHGTERVLVVEDDAPVRQLVGRVLTSAGYDWVAAPGPIEALEILTGSGGGIDLLLTDFVMPQMTGAELAQRALKLCPGLRVVYMTGYRDVPASAQAVIDREAPTISKPFTSAQLTTAIRAALNTRAP